MRLTFLAHPVQKVRNCKCMWFVVASSRLQQQKNHLHRLTAQGYVDNSSLSFGLHPASFVFNAFPALSALVAADWKNSHGHGQHIHRTDSI